MRNDINPHYPSQKPMLACCEKISLMVVHTRLRKGALLFALSGLLLLGMSILQEFLPYKWRHAIQERFDRIVPSATYAPHPDMDWEFELDFQQHPCHRRVEYAPLGVLIIGDGYAISRVWRAFRRSSA